MRERGPADLEINGVDLKAAAGVKYTQTTVIPVGNEFDWTFYLTVANTGSPTAGEVKVTVEVFDSDQTTSLGSADLVTGIDTTVTAETHVMRWGGAGAAKYKGTGGVVTAFADVLKTMAFMKVIVEIVTANDGTTSVATANMQSEEF